MSTKQEVGRVRLYLLWPCLQEGLLAGQVRGTEGRAEDVHAVTVTSQLGGHLSE